MDEESESMTGTTAEIAEGDEFTVEELLYGLMLPSGNDAAIALAKWGTQLLKGEKGTIKLFLQRMNQ